MKATTKKKAPAKKPRATDPLLTLRVEDILRIRLDGAEGWDVRRYVAEKEGSKEEPWTIAEGGKPLSERQIRNYVSAADKLIAASCRQSRKALLRKHQAQRRSLYARAVSHGDVRTALAVLADLARMQGLYPTPPARPASVSVTGVDGNTVKVVFDEKWFNPPGSTDEGTPPAATDGSPAPHAG